MLFIKNKLISIKKRINERAFTLVEVVAIIVVLAIIAVITVPVITKSIDNSKKGVAVDSAYGYRDAINRFYLSEMLDGGNTNVLDGEYDVAYYRGLGLNVSGEYPSDGWVLILNGEVSDFSLKIGKYVVTYTDSDRTIVAVKNGDIALTPTQSKIQTYIASLKQVKGNSTDIYNLPVDGVSSTEITSGWIALKNGEVIGYSLQVGSKTASLSTKTDSIDNIITYLASTYINGLTTPNSETIIDVTESGKLKGGFIEYTSNNSTISINDYSLKYEIDGITKYANYNKTNTELAVEDTKHIRPIPGMEINGVKYYDAIWIKTNSVQYHPGYVGTGNNDAIQPHKNCEGETGCQTWYPYSEFTQNGQVYVNMLMDRNVSPGIAWCSQADYMGTGNNPVSPSQNSIQNSVGISYPDGTESFPAYTNSKYKNVKGPLTVLKQLHDSTDSWNLELVADSYTEPPNNYTSFTIDYSGYKARLISVEEVAFIIRKSTAENPNSWNLRGVVYFGTLDNSFSTENATQLEQQQKYSWLFDYTKNCSIYGCSIEDSTIYGYWTSTSCVGGDSGSMLIDNFGRIVCLYVDGTTYGVRPVITVLKSEIF